MLVITMAIFVYIFFKEDNPQNNYTPSTDWLEENSLYKDTFYNDQNSNAKM